MRRLDRYSVRRMAVEAMTSPESVERTLRDDHGVRMMGKTAELLPAGKGDSEPRVDDTRTTASELARELRPGRSFEFRVGCDVWPEIERRG